MPGFTEVENRILTTYISDIDLSRSLNLIRGVMESIWAKEVRIVQNYTDHGEEHSVRVANFVEDLLNINPHIKFSEQEIYLLLAGIYLHDIGMQCDIANYTKIKEKAEGLGAKFKEVFSTKKASGYSLEEQNEIRDNHHYLSAAWIDYLYEEENEVLHSAIISIPDDLVEDLMDVCKFHSKLSINDCEDTFKFDPNSRKRMVVAILRFADELDISSRRVKLDTVKIFSISPKNSFYWWLHNHTKVTFKKPNKFLLKILLHPEDYELYHSVVREEYITSFKTKNQIVLDTLNEYTIYVVIDSNSDVEIHTRAEKFPPEITILLDKKLLNLKKLKTDPLTNLFDKEQLGIIVKEQIQIANEKLKPFSIIFIEIDDFKKYHTNSNTLSDIIIKQMGNVLAEHYNGDYVIRFGEDKFIVVSKIGTDIESGKGFAERIRRAVEEYEFFGTDGSLPIKITISCGVTVYNVNKVYSENICKQLLFEASSACTQAKKPRENGKVKNYVQIFDLESSGLLSTCDMTFEYDVFLSYSSEDKSIVHALASRLKQDGLRVHEMVIRSNYLDIPKIHEGLEKSRTLLMCLSPTYLKSEWPRYEHSSLLFRDRTNIKRRFIPLIIEDCILPDLIADIRSLDWKTRSNEEYKNILTACQSMNRLFSTNLNFETQQLNLKKDIESKEGIQIPHILNLQIPPPSNWQDFESLCCDLWREIWRDPNTKKNGRQGQPQHGVDIYGRPYNGDSWSGIQCKCKNIDLKKNLTESEVEEEVQKAKKFIPKLSEFIIATTGPKDAKIDEFTRKVTQEHLKKGLFSVHIWSWDDVKERLNDFTNVRYKYYPNERNSLSEIKRKEDENIFTRESAGKIIETVIRPLRDVAKDIRPAFESGEYIINLENTSTKSKFKFDGYEFIRICEQSNRFRLKDGKLVFSYKKDEILNKSMPRIIEYLDNYKEHFITLKAAIESLNTSNIPTFFENGISVLIKDHYRKRQLAEDQRKEEFLFKIYTAIITGKKSFNGHSWAVEVKREKSNEILDIIKKDSYSNQIFLKIESLKSEIILNINELINELSCLDEKLQNEHYL